MYTKRAIVVNMVMKSGKRCNATFDRYGMNSGLFETARLNVWDGPRTVAQAISEGITGALSSYPGDSVEDYQVTEVD